MTGSTILERGVITWYMAKPRVIEWATVKAVACHNKGFNLGLSKKRLRINNIWSKPKGKIC